MILNHMKCRADVYYLANLIFPPSIKIFQQKSWLSYVTKCAKAVIDGHNDDAALDQIFQYSLSVQVSRADHEAAAVDPEEYRILISRKVGHLNITSNWSWRQQKPLLSS